jgi:hypothetical protein
LASTSQTAARVPGLFSMKTASWVTILTIKFEDFGLRHEDAVMIRN